LSAFVFAGSSQFIAVGLVAGGAGLAVIILTTFVVNLRHALYSVTLSPHMKHLPQRWLLPLGALLTDESFVIVAERYNQPDASPHKHWYFAGSAAFMYLNWQFWTWVGIFVGANIPNPEAWGLDFAMSVTFIGMVVPSLRNRPIIAAVIVAGVSAVLFAGLPNKLGMSVATLAGVATGVMLERGRR
jgi:4-azaleucine resistance transporter AzlC